MIEGSGKLDWPRLIAGLAVIAIGIILLTGVSGLLGEARFFEFWPVILIAIGATRAADAESRERRRGGLVLTFIGCWLLVASLGLFGLDYGDSWPLVLIAIGLAILLTAGGGRDLGKSAFLILLGAWFLMTTNGYLGLTMEETWPFAVVAFGLWITISAFFGRDERCCRESSNVVKGES